MFRDATITGAALENHPGAPGLGIYIHWPFCAKKCPYCDYNSHVRARVDQEAWLEAYLQEIAWYAERLPQQATQTIFFGGGTPSLMPPQTVARLLETLNQHWPFTADCEITLEANPTSSEQEKFRAFRQAGITRLSLGVQALNDQDLKFLGRDHTAVEALQALESSNQVFDRTSFDLIYARPGQTREAWEQELAQALSLSDQHLSLYQLTIEEGTAFARQHAQGQLVPLPDSEAAGLYQLTEKIAAQAGLTPYEVSSYAAPHQQCRHNLRYWTYQPYLGLGPGAHGRIMLEGQWQATETIRMPERWAETVKQQGHGLSQHMPLERATQVEELIMLGLRLYSGITAQRFQQVAGQPWRQYFAGKPLQEMMDQGWLEQGTEDFVVSPKGRLFLNQIEQALLV